MMANKNERPIPGCKVMSKDSFWTLVEEVKNACGQDQEKYMDMLKARLKEQGAEYAQDFHNIVHAYKDLAYKYGFWSACGLMGHATDDGFIDFRAWLISQGKDVYFAVLKDPDRLAELVAGDGMWFESFSYAGYFALEAGVGMIEKPKLLTRGQSRPSLTPGGSHGDRGMLTYQFMGKQKEKR